jgi:glycosyltransferase involved in cell wall biosynthesis
VRLKNIAADRPIVVVAPYSPVGRSNLSALGAASKIASVLRLLSNFGQPMILVNSAHNELRYAPPKKTCFQLALDVSVSELTPTTFGSRFVGKFVNLFETPSIAKRLAARKPFIVWIYNAYAFEAKLALELKARYDCKIVLELEDWPTARSRGLNPKPIIDWLYFKKLLPQVDFVTCINEDVQKRTGLPLNKTMLLPSILNPLLLCQTNTKIPFSEKPYTLGYFGGLSKEKGADVLVRILDKLPSAWNLSVTGSGPLEADLLSLSRRHPGRMHFVPNASERQLYDALSQCDAIVNPHQSIAEMGNGVFPFKVFEALASGRLLISTSLPKCGVPIDKSVMYFDGSDDDLLNQLAIAETFFAGHLEAISETMSQVRESYSEQAVFRDFRARMTANA